jgi:regulator of protease activity HflC (stomatin/prohibitin superfamily)
MVGLIFGIIFILAGIIAGIVLYLKTETKYKYDDNGNPVRDADFNRITVTVHPFRKFTVLVMIIGIFLGVLITGFGCISSVDTGHIGIVRTFGKVEDFTFDSGFHFKAPWQSVTQMDNRVQKTTIELPCFSSDIQEVNTTYTVNYQIAKGNAQNLYRDIGVNYLETVVNPTIQESVKTIIARYTAEELIKKRAEVAVEIEELLTINLARYNIDVSSTAIENMDFTDSFTAAVEAKVVAEQNKIKAEKENEQALAKAENDKLIAIKNAEAQAAAAIEAANAAAAIVRIEAEAAEYQGQKDAAIALQRLASINGWTVKAEKIDEMHTKYTICYAGTDTPVEEEDLEAGAQRLIEYYYTQSWDGKLPDTFVGDGDISNIIVGTN